MLNLQPGNYNTELRRSLGGEKATLLWVRAWLGTQRSWLAVERLPAYAPELNPVEGLWSWLKGPRLARSRIG